MSKKTEIHALAGFQLVPLPGPGGPYVILTTGCRPEHSKTPDDCLLHTIGMRVKQARDLAAGLLKVADTAEEMDAGSST
ncbi:hypothetical protein [Methylobacterium brachiatum]|uniref:Uncharacterized protein n=1 Tax=Methylobacterium brachiatum TaxID=269660 RepID=A0AAJ1TVI5_9HYPH|nr:hypothetical protein [Methylobacterium brachiatum]MCB4802676.1 hypothetical protein [Methylobacterium brachiatum]MDQ0543303.1 hypothetical protein [Methylobacterium brachiatum]